MHPRTILLVEDNEDDALLAKAAFARAGTTHSLVVAEDGGDALAYLLGSAAVAPLPELVLLDLKLPGLDGFEVLERIRADQGTWAVPIVVFTSSAEDADVERSYRLGANSYLRKPVDFDEFLRVAEQLACYWLDLNQSPVTAPRT